MTKRKVVDESIIILENAQEVTLDGEVYTMRRLSTRDVFSFSKLIAKALKKVGAEEVQSQEAFGMVLMAGLAENDIEIAEFYGGLIGMTAEEFLNMSPQFFNDFLDKLPEQYDLASFFGTVLKATKSLGSLWQV